MKITAEVVHEVLRISGSEGLTKSEIAKKKGLSRASVARILGGDSGVFERCQDCGGMVSIPCRLCSTPPVKARPK